MAEINIFGWRLDSSNLGSSPYVYKNYSLQTDKPEDGSIPFLLRIGHQFSLYFRATPPFKYENIDKFRFSDHALPQELARSPYDYPFIVEIGSLRLRLREKFETRTANGMTGLQLDNSLDRTYGLLPIGMAVGGLTGIDLSDPDNPFVYFSACSFRLTVQSQTSSRTDLFKRIYESTEKKVFLLNPSSSGQFDIKFDISSEKPLPLYCDRFLPEDNFAIAMNVDTCQLHIGMAGKQANQISRIWLEPPEAGLRLTTYAVSDAANEPAAWRLRSKFIDLNCCWPTATRPSALVLAPVQPVPPSSGGEGSGGVLVTQENTKPLHGPVDNGEFYVSGVNGSLICEIEDVCSEQHSDADKRTFNNGAVASALISDLTFPWLRFSQQVHDTPRFCYTKPGIAYCPESGGQAVETLRFEGPQVAFPILPLEWMKGVSNECQTSLIKVLNEEVQHDAYAPKPTIHETYFHEAPLDSRQQTQLTALFYQDASSGTLKSRPQISTFPSSVDFGLATIRAELGADPNPKSPSSEPRKYVVIKRSDVLKLSTSFARCLGDFTILPMAASPADDAMGILKLSHEITLQTILDLVIHDPNKRQHIKDDLHPALGDPAWTGIIFFNLSANCRDASNTAVLKEIIPTTGVPLSYVAITPTKQAGQNRSSVCARIKWKNETATRTPWTQTLQDEVRCTLEDLDVSWFDSSLTSFHSTTTLHFEGLFGHRKGKPGDLTVQGNYDEATRTIRFTGAFDQPIQIIGTEAIAPFGPIKSVDVKAATIESVDGKTSFSLDGSILLGTWAGANVFAETGRPLEYKGLRMFFEHALDIAGSWLHISYPSFQFPFAIPVLKFLSFELNLDSFAVDWTKNDGVWNNYLSFPSPGGLSVPSVRFGFKVDLMKLPLLAWKNIDRLTLQLLLAFESGSFRIGIAFAGFDINNQKLDLDLLRFLRLTVKKVAQRTTNKVSALLLDDISLEVLDKPIFSGLRVAIFTAEDGRHGFLAYKISDSESDPASGQESQKGDSKKEDSKPSLLKIHWFLIAQNVRLPVDLLQKLMELPAIDPGSNPPTDTCAVRTPDETYKNGISQLADEIIPTLDQTKITTVDQWMFGAGFRLLNILEGKFLFQDGYYYGIALNSDAFCHWFGFDLFISVVYVKGTQPSDDQFTLTFRAPRITLPAFAFTGGMVSLMIGVNGSFLVDIGFPWIQSGVRRWDRALGAIITPFQGSGGFYLRRQTLSGYSEQGQTHNGMVIGAGLAVQFGLGGAYGGGMFRVTASIGIFAVVEGDALFLDKNLDGLILIGSVGLLGRASGELNWWIISIRVEVILVAEARLQLTWGCNPREAIATSTCDRKPAVLSFQMTVYASVSAAACIGWGPFRVCAGITVSVAIPVSPNIEFKLAA